MQRIAMAAAFYLLPVTLCAQWLNFRQPGIPRRPDGKPDLTAPAPRAADGKPDLSGLWSGGPNPGQAPYPYSVDLIQDIRDEAIFKPAAEVLFQERLGDLGRDWPARHCLPIRPSYDLSGTYRIIQSPTVVALLFNSENTGDG